LIKVCYSFRVLAEHKAELQKTYTLKSIALVCSFARGEQYQDSDVDMLAEFTEPLGMELIRLALKLGKF
jgi:predicted nucleotidyltransferase